MVIRIRYWRTNAVNQYCLSHNFFFCICLTGSFSGVINGDTTECFAQKIIASENGAVAFFGAYNTAGRGINQLLEGAVNGLFNDSIRHRLGDVLIHAYANTNNTNTVNQYYPTVTQSERIRAAWQLTIPRVGNWCSFISVCLSII